MKNLEQKDSEEETRVLIYALMVHSYGRLRGTVWIREERREDRRKVKR